jgi:predicted RNA-binding protein with RPS1 domain
MACCISTACEKPGGSGGFAAAAGSTKLNSQGASTFAYIGDMRNRIKAHRKVRVGDLVPHELNPRVHTDEQREALQTLIGEIGFARSVLAYELPDGRLKLIDGHLRQSELDPDEEIDVEILDVDDAEARKLLLSIDPLAALADYDDSALQQLREITETDNATLGAMWANLQKKDQAAKEQLQKATRKPKAQEHQEQYIVLIECSSETEQIQLLRRFKNEGLTCKALTS